MKKILDFAVVKKVMRVGWFSYRFPDQKVANNNMFTTVFKPPFLARLLILIKKGGLLQLKFIGVGVGVNIYLWAR